MARISGSTRLKVQKAPALWDISRKRYRFILKPVPGPHAISESYPLGVFLRDILRLTNTMRESRRVIIDGKIKVDGKIRYDEHFPVGLMDTISIDSINRYYRLLPDSKRLLIPLEIDKNESNLKICKIKKKVIIKGNKIQYGLHDGRTIINNINAKVNDSLLLRVPEQEIVEHIKLEKGVNALIIKGENAGKIGIIEEIKEGTYTLPKRVILNINDRLLELPVDMVMVVGSNIPIKLR
ncbi:MAG: 30S ribosomal protein S4e [Candidatus Nitrosocaldaceae archaeon]|nr:MAG: 30S ribosomal protein S4e [Candidatus Nitrosocaldaceae archaeon]